MKGVDVDVVVGVSWLGLLAEWTRTYVCLLPPRRCSRPNYSEIDSSMYEINIIKESFAGQVYGS